MPAKKEKINNTYCKEIFRGCIFNLAKDMKMTGKTNSESLSYSKKNNKLLNLYKLYNIRLPYNTLVGTDIVVQQYVI